MSEQEKVLGIDRKAFEIIVRTLGYVGVFAVVGILSAIFLDLVPTVAPSSFKIFWGATCFLLGVIIFGCFSVFPIIFIVRGYIEWERYDRR